MQNAQCISIQQLWIECDLIRQDDIWNGYFKKKLPKLLISKYIADVNRSDDDEFSSALPKLLLSSESALLMPHILNHVLPFSIVSYSSLAVENSCIVKQLKDNSQHLHHHGKPNCSTKLFPSPLSRLLSPILNQNVTSKEALFVADIAR